MALWCLLGLFTFATSSSDAQDRRHRERIAEGAPVALQPFTLDEPAPIHLAYYAPRAIPRAEPITEDKQPDPIPQIATSASGPTVSGRRAVLRYGIAYAPANAPATVNLGATGATTGVDFGIGGSLTLASTTVDGVYSGTFTVTANYQ